EHEKLARIQNRGLCRNCDYAPDHDVTQWALERGGQKSTRGQHSHETFVGIDRKKIDNPLTNSFASNTVERCCHCHVCIQQRKIFPRMFDNPRIEIRNASSLRHSQLLRDERCLCSLEFVPPR